jgi:hypothetical protein
MQRIQRKVGIFLPRTVDDAEVGRLLSDFDTADKTLSTVRDVLLPLCIN